MANYKFNIIRNEGGSLKTQSYKKELDFKGFQLEMKEINRLEDFVEVVAFLDDVQVSYIGRTVK